MSWFEKLIATQGKLDYVFAASLFLIMTGLVIFGWLLGDKRKWAKKAFWVDIVLTILLSVWAGCFAGFRQHICQETVDAANKAVAGKNGAPVYKAERLKMKRYRYIPDGHIQIWLENGKYKKISAEHTAKVQKEVNKLPRKRKRVYYLRLMPVGLYRSYFRNYGINNTGYYPRLVKEHFVKKPHVTNNVK